MAALSAVCAESKRSTVAPVSRSRSGLLERGRVGADRAAPAIEARELTGHLGGRLLEQRGDLHLDGVRLRERGAIAGLDDELGKLGEQDLAAVLDGRDVLDATGGDEAELLLGEGRQRVGRARLAHASAAPAAATCAQASRSSLRSRATSTIFALLRSRRASLRQRLQ